MNSLFTLKLLAAGSILLITIVAGLLPLFMTEQGLQRRLLSFGESFAGGVFLSAGFLHLLPEGVEKLEHALPEFDYPVIFLICAATILFLRVFEKGLASYFDRCEEKHHYWLAYILVVLLSIHSVIAGAALGVTASVVDLLVIGLAILAHKGAESFALTAHLRKHHLTRSHMFKVLVLFSLMTPIGIATGSIVAQLLTDSPGMMAESVFNAIAAGTFIYISTQYHFEFSTELNHDETSLHVAFFALGMTLMALVAIWA